jgi:preprotein translocase subunit SecF
MIMFSFMKWRAFYLVLSALVIVPGVLSLLINGFRPSIDFTGGALLEVKTEGTEITREFLQAEVADIYEVNAVQSSGQNQYIIRGKTITNDQKNQVLTELNEKVGPVTELRFETVGPTLGRELLVKTLTAAILAALLIALYVWWQFDELKYGVSAILAMLHDTLVLLGSFSLLGYFMGIEVDVLFVTAIMTTLSFSVHDTIVVYHRIRELKQQQPRLKFIEIVDLAVLQTLSRSINNSLTIIIMLFSLVLLGGETIRWFSVALLIGAVTGTYSSTFVAAPLLLLWDEVKSWRIKK